MIKLGIFPILFNLFNFEIEHCQFRIFNIFEKILNFCSQNNLINLIIEEYSLIDGYSFLINLENYNDIKNLFSEFLDKRLKS